MLKKWILLLLTTAVVLCACHSQVYNQTEANVADVKLKLADARKKSDAEGKNSCPLVMKRGMYIDTTPVNLERQPTWLKNHIVIRGDQLPFSYYSRVIASGAGANILTKYQTGLDPAIITSLSYSGTVKGALDLLAAKTGYVYNVKYNNVYWQAYITRTFDIAFMPGDSDYLMGKASGGGGTQAAAFGGGAGQAAVANYTSSDDSTNEYSSLKGSISVWKDIEATLKQLVSPDGKVVVSQSSTSVTVRDKPTNVALIEQYIKNLNHNMSKQVLVKVQVLDVKLHNDYEWGINWQIIEHAFNKSPFVLNGNFGTPVAITALTAQSAIPNITSAAAAAPQFGTQYVPKADSNNNIPGYTILFNALNQQGKTSIVTEPRVVCLNNQVSVVRIISQNGYLASVQNTTSTSSGSTNLGMVTSQLTPGTVITGVTLYILPKIMKASIYLQVNADLSTNDGFTDVSSGGPSASSSSTFIQVPNITEKHFNQRAVIKSGDTLILAGFRQMTNIANANQFMTSQALGGKGSTQANTETIILITPYLLPGTGV
jgi:type IVB pilus formation R64 PilN family outer membrane protein